MVWTNVQQRREWRQRQKAKGLCVDCTRPAPNGTLCDYHREKMREYQRAHRPPPKPRLVKTKPERQPRIKRVHVEGMCRCGQPVKPNRKKCLTCLGKQAAAMRIRSQQFRDAGCCSICPRPHALGKTLCDYHLEMLRVRAKERQAERKRAGLCVECGRVSELGQARCLICTEPHRDGLPQPIRTALTAARRQEQQAERDAAASAKREFIERNLYLIESERQRDILRRRYGFDEQSSQTLEEAGRALGITRERVRQLQQIAEEKIFMFTIEKDVPIPSPSGRDIATELRSTFEAMSVGESFVVPKRLRQHAQAMAHRMGLLITTRKVSDSEARVWLVSKNGTGQEGQVA